MSGSDGTGPTTQAPSRRHHWPVHTRRRRPDQGSPQPADARSKRLAPGASSARRDLDFGGETNTRVETAELTARMLTLRSEPRKLEAVGVWIIITGD